MNITAIGIIVLLSLVGIIVRPFKITEAVWPLTGAVLLIIFKLISLSEGLMGIKKGIDVYLFLGGMMLLAETAKSEKLFDWLAAHAIRISKGSPKKLFFLIYLVGIIVTVFLSNDPTVVVLTPAVAVATKTAKIKYPLPFLFICAFIANAASFVLPISNPANLVIYGNFMPTLVQWLKLYFLPSFVAIASTYLMLYITQRKLIIQKIQTNIVIPELGIGGKTALIGIIATTIILLISSAYGIQLGLPTAITGLFTTSVVLLRTKKNPWGTLKNVSWSVLFLVAGLFIMVEALNKTGIIAILKNFLNQSIQSSINTAIWSGSIIIALACNLMNNLPVGLIAGSVVQNVQTPEIVKQFILISIDLGPNLSITGSLATILWIVTLRREGVILSPRSFFKLGALIMTVSLLLTIASIVLF